MGALIYSFSLRFYSLAIRIAAMVNPKAREFVEGRKSQKSILHSVNPSNENLIWMHCASLGEFEQGRPVLEALNNAFPHYKFVLSFFSPSGYEVYKDKPVADKVLYLPLDNRSNAKEWIESIRPTLAIFVKYEFWHHYTLQLSEHNIPILSISSIFRSSQPFFRWYGKFNRRILNRFTHFFVQDSQSVELLKQINISQASLSGDTRFDRVFQARQSVKEVKGIPEFLNGKKKSWVIGSAWPADLDVLTPFIQQSDSKFIVAPHEISESFMSSIEKQMPGEVIRYSNLADFKNQRVLIIDNIGMLSSLYQYAEYAWIGGAYGKGLHNTLEASVYGTPVFFGDQNYRKFREAMIMIERGGAFAIRDTTQLFMKYNELQDLDKYRRVKQINESIVTENLGASKLITEYCKEILRS